jgi:FixJ family two-component response regulator
VDTAPVKVLLIEDDEDDYVFVRDLLKEIPGRPFDVDWAKTYEEASAALTDCRHDVYLVDYRLGAHDGLELLRLAKEGNCRPPMIILTGYGDYEVDLAAMKAGAADYLPKDHLSARLLERSIRYAIDHTRTKHALEKARNEVEKRVEERTAALAESNRGLKYEIDKRRSAEKRLQETVAELEKALAEVKTLSGMLPICSSCKKVRDDKGYWNQIERYIKDHSEAEFSHSICPDCARKLYADLEMKEELRKDVL